MLASAKINLYLHVTGKLENGYHTLDSLMIPINLHDEINVQKSDKLELYITGNNTPQLLENNIILEAANLLAQEADIDNPVAKITLQKNIPIGAGLGGGSADAAATLKLLNKFWNINFDDDKLSKIGLSLGADVPFCLYNKPALVSSIGENITPTSIPKLHILLVNPKKPLSTKEVFNFEPVEVEKEADYINLNNFYPNIKNRKNSLETNAIKLLPVVNDIINIINKEQGCILSRMSGSGSSCFGLFESEESANNALDNIKNIHPYWLSIIV